MKNLNEDIKTGQFKNVYLLYGEEAYLGSHNPRLHTDEVLIALSVSAATDRNAQLALEQLPKLKGCQLHTSVMVSQVDINIFKKLFIQATFEPKYEKKTVFQEEKGI